MTLARQAILVGAALLLVPTVARAATLEVGPGMMFAKPCAAILAAADGDTIEIDASGSYDGDVCAWTTNNLTIRGINGRPKIDAAGNSSGGKAIWVIGGHDTVIENVEMSGCTVPDDNGAPIRQEAPNLILRRVYFHDNQDGILAGADPTSTILIEYSEFANNGAGDGFSHNMYINAVGHFTLRYSWSHSAKVGHLVKSRALVNHILYNRLTDESGTASYEIDLPNGGTSFVIGNLVEQGTQTQNSTIVDFGFEGAVAGSTLFLVNNTFVNDLGQGTFVGVDASVTTPVVLRNNIFFGGGTITSQMGAIDDHNVTSDPAFVNAASFDYHLTSGSPAVDAGVDPGMGGGESLAPTNEYVHPASTEGRMTVGVIDVGAYELGGGFGGAGTGGASASAGSGTTGAGGATTLASTSGAGGSGAAPANGETSGDTGGCGCRVASGRERSVAWLAAAALALAAARRRRRR